MNCWFWFSCLLLRRACVKAEKIAIARSDKNVKWKAYFLQLIIGNRNVLNSVAEITQSLEPGFGRQGTRRKSGCLSWSIENIKATYSFSSVNRFDTIDSSKTVMKRSRCVCITTLIYYPCPAALYHDQKTHIVSFWVRSKKHEHKPQADTASPRRVDDFLPRIPSEFQEWVPMLNSNTERYHAMNSKNVGTFLPFWTHMLAQPTQQSIHLSAAWQ